MDVLVTDLMMKILMISLTFSIILTALIQKFKTLKIIKKSWEIWIINLIFAFSIGIPFTIYFYEFDIYSAIWVSLFSFIGAPTIYDVLKQQNIINFTPKSLSDVVTINKNNEIKRST